jgi:hypothetical protein
LKHGPLPGPTQRGQIKAWVADSGSADCAPSTHITRAASPAQTAVQMSHMRAVRTPNQLRLYSSGLNPALGHAARPFSTA